MKFTRHTEKRIQQRGIRSEVVDLILKYGDHELAPMGAIRIRIDQAAYQKAIKELKNTIQFLDKAKNRKIVLKDGFILTAY